MAIEEEHQGRSLEEVEDELEELQLAYLNEEDEVKQMQIERKFTNRLIEATSIDNVDRIAANVNITNWIREA